MNALMLYMIHACVLIIAALAMQFLGRSASRTAAVPVNWAKPIALGLALVTFAISEPQDWPFQDFTDAYYEGGKAALEGREQVVSLLDEGVHGFVNLPVVPFLSAASPVLPPEIAAALFFILGVASTVLAFAMMVRLAGLRASAPIALGLMFSVNGPLMNSLREGNTTHFALLSVALALVLMRSRRDALAGSLLGLAALLEPHLLLLGVYFLLRRRYACAFAGALVIAAAGAVSLLLFGWDAHVTWYLNAVAKAGKEPLAAFNVQSLAAWVARLELGSDYLTEWRGEPLSRDGFVVVHAMSALLFITIAGACAGAAGSPARSRRGAVVPGASHNALSATEWEVMLVLVLACITSPLAWSHYYALMLLPFAYLLAPGGVLECGSRALRWSAWASVLLVSLPVVFPPQRAMAEGLLSGIYLVAVSHYLYGGLILLAVLIHVRVGVRAGSDATPLAAMGPGRRERLDRQEARVSVRRRADR